jgi:outer membrane protein TolC
VAWIELVSCICDLPRAVKEDHNMTSTTVRIPGRAQAVRAFAAVAGLLAAAAALAQPAAPPSPAEKADLPKLNLLDCLRIANDRQPTLTAARASLAARLAAQRGVNELHPPNFLAPDLPIRRKQALRGVDAAEAEVYQAEYDTSYAVIRNYYSAVYARQQYDVAADVVGGLTFWRDLVGRIVQGGGDPNLNQDVVDRLNVYLKLAEAKQAQALVGIDRALAALREAMGVGADCGDFRTADGKLPVPTAKPIKVEIVTLALNRRGELVQAMVAADVTRLEICAQEAFKMRPTVRTFASSSDIHAKSVPTGLRNGEYRPGAMGVEMPVSVAGNRQSRVEQVQAYSARADAVVDKTRKLITLEAENEYEIWLEAERQVDANREAARLSKLLAERTRNNVANIKKEDILQTDVLAGQAQSAFNEALYHEILSLANMERITAGGFNAGLVPNPAPAPAATAPAATAPTTP